MSKNDLAGTFLKAYSILGFREGKNQEMIDKLDFMWQLTVANELLNGITAVQTEEFRKIAVSKDKAEKQSYFNSLMKKYSQNKEFVDKAKVELAKVNHDHAEFLKTLGNYEQKAEVAKVLANI